jgi:hypothetical protein
MLKKNLWQWLIYLLMGGVLFFIFIAYFAPDMMIAITNQVWALCGW